MEDRLLSVDEVAAHLGVHRDTVYSMIKSRRLTAFQLGGRKATWRISQSDLIRFVEQQKAAHANDPLPESQDDHSAELLAFDEDQRRKAADFGEQQAADRRDFLEGQAKGRSG